MRKRPTLLITNDDGIQAEGLRSLADALEPLGDLWVVAPQSERSASSHSLTLRHSLEVRWTAERRAAVSGSPADAVLLALDRLMPVRPDLVVSGINHGPNLGDDVNYSGTVGAAMEATVFEVPAMAVSLASWQPGRFDAAATVAAHLARRVLAEGLPAGTILNVNVPDLPPDEFRGAKVVRLARRTYKDMIREEAGPPGAARFSIGHGIPVNETGEDTDCGAVAEGWVTVTPLGLDMTAHAALEGVRSWDLDLPRPSRRG